MNEYAKDQISSVILFTIYIKINSDSISIPLANFLQLLKIISDNAIP